MPNKEIKGNAPDTKVAPPIPLLAPPVPKTTVNAKPGVSKVVVKDATMSPGAPVAVEEERTELLGSLTTQQQQRTSARVIKKLKLEPQVEKRDCTTTECETPNKVDEKDPLKFPTVKQRMPKALWSADEKSHFFEALNEYGKDFDAITAYICAKMKKKAMHDGNLKTKTQVSHFYYRTWHKLSKHVHFDENVKKVAQELYALINYGELRRKLASVNEKTCARLSEMVRCGRISVRARGKTISVRTPMCRALRRLNQIAERECGTRVCSRAQVVLAARNAHAWARVQAAAHNPRCATAVPLRTALAALLRALQRRWRTANYNEDLPEATPKLGESSKDNEEFQSAQTETKDDNPLNLVTDRMIVLEHNLPKKLALHVGPRPGAEIHLPVLSPSEQLSSQKICFSSYLERMGSLRRDKDGPGVKIRTPKRQRKDSATDKDKENDPKKIKVDETETTKLMHIDETAIDGIELMASYKTNHEDEEKPSTEDEKELKSEETAEEEVDRDLPERDKYMSEKEKDSFSEMEDDEKYAKSDTDNESDGKGDKTGKTRKFKNLKVKFRLRPMKRGGSIYTMVLDKEQFETKTEELKTEEAKADEVKELEIKEELKEEVKPDFDVEMAIKQIRKGWSVYDAGDLTIGDLYLMFGSRSKLELDYWWAEPTPPLPQPMRLQKQTEPDKTTEKEVVVKDNKTPEKDSSVEDERDKRESDTDIFSPKNTFSQDSNDGMSGDERKNEQLASPDHKTPATLKLVSLLVNRPGPDPTPNGFSLLSDRLKRLLALAGNGIVSGPAPAARAPPHRCGCGHVCDTHSRRQKQQGSTINLPSKAGESTAMFRHPTPIAPRPETEGASGCGRGYSLDDMPRRRRGRAAGRTRAGSRVVVQRLLPLLPKLPPPSNLIPVKIIPNSPPVPPKILPKPPDSLSFYVLSESNGQFYFHDGDCRIPITQLPEESDPLEQEDAKTDEEDDLKDSKDLKNEMSSNPEVITGDVKPEQAAETTPKIEQNDIASFLPAESMSLSPSRLLRETEGWLEGSVPDFSLSSFLGHLEGQPRPELPVEPQLQSLLAEGSVDYVAKFADLANTHQDNP